MRKTACEAIVLRITDYGEADRIVSFFTREEGRLSGIARGAKRSRRRFGGALEPFAHLGLQLKIPYSGLTSIESADVVTIHPGIRVDLSQIGCAAYACELVERFTPEGEANPRLFRLLSSYLERLDSAPPSPSDRRLFTVNFLKILGYQPPLENAPISPETATILARAMRAGSFGSIHFPDAALHEADRLLDPAVAAHLDRPLKSLAFLRECSTL
ncbi:DNA repair protein RecO [Geomonas sp. RF6]|uniref:DNA repair protein RecO n=1 Tax=Geomonas sp. RF6 TaxID=2897342 RepID=UPI001E46AB18|nr:DNA repair protein RecO [Geomonas sp. RF6]UFS68848.1 DNA repair protein RecO [Geomonas sp. RF6]